MIYLIHIPDKAERVRFAAEIKKIIPDSQDFIPGKRKHVYQPDIGMRYSKIEEKELTQIEALIERRGYSIYKQEGPDHSEPSASAGVNHNSQQKDNLGG
ncbi:MAG: hypothetical protein CMB80_12295 [Flammeovirgaceae bacterium]|nr:hypothetical protein [Flammeovirgaceae bacterium]